MTTDIGEPMPELLREVILETGHALSMWDTGRTDRGRTVIGYEFSDANGKRIFRGEDFRPSPLDADDSDETLRALLGFLTLQPGDTDADYFEAYSDEQREFAESSDCETLAWLYSEEGPGEFVYPEDEELA